MIETGVALRTTVRDNDETFYLTVTRFPNRVISCYVQDHRGRVLEISPYVCHPEFNNLINLIQSESTQ